MDSCWSSSGCRHSGCTSSHWCLPRCGMSPRQGTPARKARFRSAGKAWVRNRRWGSVLHHPRSRYQSAANAFRGCWQPPAFQRPGYCSRIGRRRRRRYSRCRRSDRWPFPRRSRCFRAWDTSFRQARASLSRHERSRDCAHTLRQLRIERYACGRVRDALAL